MDITQEDSVPGAPVGNESAIRRSASAISPRRSPCKAGRRSCSAASFRISTDDSKTGVPILSSIPLLGNLFGNNSKTHDRTELIILITPRVVVNADDAQEMTEEYEKKFQSLTPIHTANPPAGVAQPIAVPERSPAPPPTPLPEQQLPKNLKDRPDEH